MKKPAPSPSEYSIAFLNANKQFNKHTHHFQITGSLNSSHNIIKVAAFLTTENPKEYEIVSLSKSRHILFFTK
jgi:hypothetical protein